MTKLLCILGPTASGKTDLGISIAKKLSGEIVSCDSRQVYKGLDIGTGKLPGNEVFYEKHNGWWMVDEVPVWLYDVASPIEKYDVWQYVRDARSVIERIEGRGNLPIIVGGTGLYLKGLLNGFSEMEIPVDEHLRAELSHLSNEELLSKLSALDPAQLNSLNNAELHNNRRLIRRIEKMVLKNDVSDSPFQQGISGTSDVLKIGLTTGREHLYKRIDERVKKRVQGGMIEEARRLFEEGLSYERMRELGLEYRYLADFLERRIKTEEEFIIQLQYKIHQYAKRQLTWFRADSEICWFDINCNNFSEEVEQKVINWYNS